MPDGNHIVVTLWDLLVTVNENCPRKAKMAKKRYKNVNETWKEKDSKEGK